MLITCIELENIKSYRHIMLDFRRGTTAISGANGAGKTTLVEAIGFALFGYLPYNHDKFVREGEKGGKVVVTLVGSDDRPYTVERRCGAGARWVIYDKEADMRLEQRADVQDKLHDLFGIDRERSLEALFRDALGVPQGTFTSIFLETASKRKQTFDALLQIEDFKTAADNLLDTQRLYKDQMQTQTGIVERLQYETRDLDEWRDTIRQKTLQHQEQQRRNIQLGEQLAKSELRKTKLDQQAEQVRDLGVQHEQAQSHYTYAQALLQNRSQAHQDALEALRIVTESQDDYQSNQQATNALRLLRQETVKRDELRKNQTTIQHGQIKSIERIKNHQSQLEEIEKARRRIADLAPHVDHQIDLEHLRDEARQQEQRYEEVRTTDKRLRNSINALQQELTQRQTEITAIEPLIASAQLLEAHTEAYNELRVQTSTRNEKQRQLNEKEVSLQEKRAEREPLADKVHRSENNLKFIDEHRREAEEMPVIEDKLQQLMAQKHHLQGNVEGYARSRAQSAGGQCPLLNESCLNIGQRGIVSLEAYFENLLIEEKHNIEGVTLEQTKILARKDQVKKFADALDKEALYTEKRDGLRESAQRLEQDITRLELDIATLQHDISTIDQLVNQLQQAEKNLQDSKQADKRVRALNGLYQQREQLQKRIEQSELEAQTLQQEAAKLQDSGAKLKQLDSELEELKDPRGESRAKQEIIVREPHYQEQLQSEQTRLHEFEQQLQSLNEQLVAYTSLDKDIAYQEALLQRSEAGYLRYLNHQKAAQTLPEREQAYQQQQQSTAQAEQHLQTIQQAFRTAQASFQQQELDALRSEIDGLRREQIELAGAIKDQQRVITELEQKISTAEVLRVELATAQAECQTLEDLEKMTKQFREMIKTAAPHVLKAMLADISAEANRIFGEVIGDRRAQLSWRNDYEIILRQQGVDRTFAQLSGGEQMSAALSVRLALLKKLSTLNIAFFDEPTQNMDELRRMNLADQIRRVRGFDQLIVISHDDTFEQGLDSLVRLNKINGETRMLDDDESLPQSDIGLIWQNDGQDHSLLQATN
jgi:exonuclease SbcC